MPFFDENPITPSRVGGRLWRAWNQNRQARTVRGRSVPSTTTRTTTTQARDDVLTTLDATIRPMGSGRYRRLGWAAGEPHRVRDETGVHPGPDRAEQRKSLLYFAQHTDLHLCDAQAEARLVGAEGFGWLHPGAGASHRPQETMANHVFDQIIRATNRVVTSPASGATMAWCAQTGDHTDNRTAVAARWWLEVGS